MKTFTLHNSGTITSFNPDKTIIGLDGKPVSMLEFNKELVRNSGRRDVFILDHKGREVDCTTQVPLNKAA